MEKIFHLKERGTDVKTEVIAGITTFLTMAYILAVNPNILGTVMDRSGVFVATAIASAVATFVMAFLANYPIALSAGLGLNAYFAYTVCLNELADVENPFTIALTAVFVEGIIFIILTITNIRELIVNSIPDTLKKAIGAGIGMFIAFIGLENAGIIVANPTTEVSLGDLNTLNSLLTLIGFLITGILVILKVRGSFLIGIIATTLIGIPMGLTHWNGLVSAAPSIEPIFCQFQWNHIFSLDMFVVVFTLLFFDIFDTIGTVVGISVKANMVDENGKVEGVSRILMADAVSTTVGACLGASTTTTFVESAAGVSEGGRSGLTAFVIAVCFALSLLFSPLFLAVPSAATSPVLVIVGVMMASPLKDIDWDDYSECIPAFITILLMPLAYSISDGIMLGMISYVVLNSIVGIFRKGYIKKINVTMWVLTILFILRYIFI